MLNVESVQNTYFLCLITAHRVPGVKLSDNWDVTVAYGLLMTTLCLASSCLSCHCFLLNNVLQVLWSVTTNTLNTLGIAYQTRCHHVRLESIWNCCRWAERTKSTLQGKGKRSTNMKDKKKEWTSDWIQQWYTYFQCFQIKLSSDTFKLCLSCGKRKWGRGASKSLQGVIRVTLVKKGEFHQTKNIDTVSSETQLICM